VTKLGVDTWVWHLYEIEASVLRVNSRSEQKPVKEYLDAQGRFRGMSPE
jgi:pyruvate/2-oxoacid:ferredoxin oxidoreductase beta subunit